MICVTENRLEPPENGRGLFNYLWDQVKVPYFQFSDKLSGSSVKKKLIISINFDFVAKTCWLNQFCLPILSFSGITPSQGDY